MSKKLRNTLGCLLALTLLGATAVGCADEAAGDDEDANDSSSERVTAPMSSLKPGVNSEGCLRSPYNCALNPTAGTQRVARPDGVETWDVDQQWLIRKKLVDPATGLPFVPVIDGNGLLMAVVAKKSFTLNYGQTIRMYNHTWVYALSTGAGSSGWIPIDSLLDPGAVREKVGEVNARGAGLKEIGCYEVRNSFDTDLLNYKVVKNASVTDSVEPNDYLPLVRKTNKIYVNLAFSAPGDGLGAPAIDIFPAGTKFQRLDVPTWERGSGPSLDVKLYTRTPGTDRFNTLAPRTMKFVYGYVKSSIGVVRHGWMALDGLKVSSGCPSR